METRLKRRRAQEAPNHFSRLVRDVRNIIRGILRPIDLLMLDEA